MTIPQSPEADRSRASPETLGDLLYADPAGRLVSEEDWVALLRSIAARDEGALRALYDRMHRLVFTLAVRITRDPETAEELTVDVFQGVWQRAATYDAEGGTVVGWIMNQARSRAIDRVRFERRKKRINPYPEDPLQATTVRGPQEEFATGERARGLREALAVLTADEREAIQVAFFSGLTHVETAERLGQPLGTVKTRIRSGLLKLRQAMAEAGREP